jgi:hypothetical protein
MDFICTDRNHFDERNISKSLVTLFLGLWSELVCHKLHVLNIYGNVCTDQFPLSLRIGLMGPENWSIAWHGSDCSWTNAEMFNQL